MLYSLYGLSNWKVLHLMLNNESDMTIHLDARFGRMLEAIACSSKISLETAITQAVSNELFLDELERQGQQLLIKQGQDIYHLIRSTAASF
jgi:hypothetical protein